MGQDHAFTPEEIEFLRECGTRREYAAGEVVIAKGSTGDSMFYLDAGEAIADFEDDRDPRVMAAGGFFGELSFINPEHTRSATVRAGEGAVAYEIGPDAEEALTTRAPRAFLALLRRTCAFLVDGEERLIQDLRRKNKELEKTLDFLRRTREELDYQELLAQTDGLTGLYNRRCMDLQLPKFLARVADARDPAEGLALLMIDLDNFKPVNDTYGHAAGDRVLIQVGEILKSGVRRSDLPCRVGGDEFTVLLADVSEETARAKALEILEAIADLPPPAPDADVRITGSMGGTMYRPGETATEFLKRADEDVYRSKDAGRDCLFWSGAELARTRP